MDNGVLVLASYGRINNDQLRCVGVLEFWNLVSNLWLFGETAIQSLEEEAILPRSIFRIASHARVLFIPSKILQGKASRMAGRPISCCTGPAAGSQANASIRINWMVGLRRLVMDGDEAAGRSFLFVGCGIQYWFSAFDSLDFMQSGFFPS